MTPRDLYQLEVLTGLTLSPDGRNVIYSRLRVEKETEKKISGLFMVNTQAGKERQYTFGRASVHTPLWSPDGRFIAFLSGRGEENQFQICLLPADGGEARPLTRLKWSFVSLSWNSDSKWLAFAFRATDATVPEREKDEKKKKHPSVLEIHSGPQIQYGFHFMHKFHVLAARGYMVYFCNPRGSRGYSGEHTAAIWNQWGSVDYNDLMAFADFMEKKALHR